MASSIEHQDRSGDAGMPLIVVDRNRNGAEVQVPADADPSEFAQRHGYEALIRCIDHPDAPAVDCLICVPEDE